MAEMIKPAQNNKDEVDLVQVLERIIRFFSNHKKDLIAAPLAGMLCGCIIYMVQPKVYNSTLILHSQVLSNSEEIEIIDNWNELRKDGEYGVLSKNLNCGVYILRNVKMLSASNIQNVTAGSTSGFTVDVLVSDTSILENLQKAVIYGLENNEYVKEKVNFKRDNTTKLIASINREIAKLDSTKKKIESNNTGRTPGSSSFIVDISDVNVQMITLNEKLIQNQEALKFVDAIQLLQNFEKYSKPTSPRLLKMILSGFFGGIFIGFVWSIWIDVKLKMAMSRRVPQTVAK
jgi:hypothetical protein